MLWTVCERRGARLMLFIDGKVLQMDYLGLGGGCACVRLCLNPMIYIFIFSAPQHFLPAQQNELSPRYVVSRTPINYSSRSSCAHEGFICDSENPRMNPRNISVGFERER